MQVEPGHLAPAVSGAVRFRALRALISLERLCRRHIDYSDKRQGRTITEIGTLRTLEGLVESMQTVMQTDSGGCRWKKVRPGAVPRTKASPVPHSTSLRAGLLLPRQGGGLDRRYVKTGQCPL